MCVAGQYVYVTGYGNDYVTIFITEAEYVTSFGRRGSREDNFNNPQIKIGSMELTAIIIEFKYFIFCSCYKDKFVESW